MDCIEWYCIVGRFLPSPISHFPFNMMILFSCGHPRTSITRSSRPIRCDVLQTYRQTDRPMDRANYRGALSHLKAVCLVDRSVGRSVAHSKKSQNPRLCHQKSGTNLLFHSSIYLFIHQFNGSIKKMSIHMFREAHKLAIIWPCFFSCTKSKTLLPQNKKLYSVIFFFRLSFSNLFLSLEGGGVRKEKYITWLLHHGRINEVHIHIRR